MSGDRRRKRATFWDYQCAEKRIIIIIVFILNSPDQGLVELCVNVGANKIKCLRDQKNNNLEE